MKRLFLLSALAALSAFAGNLTETMGQDPKTVPSTKLSFVLPMGETTVDMKYPLVLERVEGMFLEANKTLKIDRVREVSGVPYVSHFTNDGSAVDWKITDRTTFTQVPECFTGPIELQGGTLSDDWTSSPYQQVNSTKLTFYGYYKTDSQGRGGYAPWVGYYFAENGLCGTSACEDGHRELITPLGYPNRFKYNQSGYVRRRENWNYYYGAHLLERVVTNTVPEKTVTSVVTSNDVETAVTYLGHDDDVFEKYGYDYYDLFDADTNILVITETKTYATTVVSNRSNSLEWALPEGSELRTTLDSEYPGTVPCVNSSAQIVVRSANPTVVTNTYLTSVRPIDEGAGSAPKAYFRTVVTNVVKTTVTDRTVYGVTDILTHIPSDYAGNNQWSSVVFRGVTDMPTNIVVDVSGNTQPIRFVSGHTVTNFAVWSTCSMVTTNQILSATVSGKYHGANITENGMLLPKDRIVISGTAMPTGHIIGIGSK